MEVPKEIEKAIKDAGKAFKTARENEKLIRNWLEENGYEEDDTVNDQLIDCIESGLYGPKTFIQFLKSY